MMQGKALIDDIDKCQVKHGQCAFWWLGQHSFVVKLGSTICWLDPFLTPGASRKVAPLLRPEELTNATLVLGSHDHGDHIDRPAWPAIAAASPGATFVVPELLRDRIVKEIGLPAKRVKGLDDGKSVTIAGVKVSAIPAAHELLDQDPATGRFPHLGYILEANGFCLYHAGDTCIYEGMQTKLRRWRLDLAFLPINGRDAKRLSSDCIGNMTYQEAVDLAGAVKPGLTVPAHFEMFAMNSENPTLFVDYMRVKYPGLKTMIPVHGDRVMV
jgi:L-ascorbate metabolism protein UlaG (beta-lactamase superfamily)